MIKILSLISALLVFSCNQNDKNQAQSNDIKNENNADMEKTIPALQSINFQHDSKANSGNPRLLLGPSSDSDFASFSICPKNASSNCSNYMSVRDILFLSDLEKGTYIVAAKSCIEESKYKCSNPISLEIDVKSYEKGETDLYALPQDIENAVIEASKELKNIASKLKQITPGDSCNDQLTYTDQAIHVADLSIFSIAKSILRPQANIKIEKDQKDNSDQKLQLVQSPRNPYILQGFDPSDIVNLSRIEELKTKVNSKFESAARSLARKRTQLTYKPHIASIFDDIVENEVVRLRFNGKMSTLAQNIKELHDTGKFLFDAYKAKESSKLSREEQRKISGMIEQASTSYNTKLAEYNKNLLEFNQELEGSVKNRLEMSNLLVKSKLGLEKKSFKPSQKVINAIIANAEVNALKRSLDSIPKVRRIRLTEEVNQSANSEGVCLLATQTDKLFGFYYLLLANLGEIYKNSILLTELDTIP